MLIVDDEADLSETLARLLGRLGHTCLVAASGSEAIRLIDTMTPDLVVTDLHMPGGTLYLAKPFANADMLDAVQRALDSRKGIPARECHRLRAAVALVEGTDGFQSAMGDAQPRMARGLKPEASRAVGDPARREKEAEMFSVVPTLSEEACQFALHSPRLEFGLPSKVWIKIVNATIDRSLGDRRAQRHPILDAQGALMLREYYGRLADAFTTRGDNERATTCVEAEIAVRQALRIAGASR